MSRGRLGSGVDMAVGTNALVIRNAKDAGFEYEWTLSPGEVAPGLVEDGRYVLELQGLQNSRVFVDDVELSAARDSAFPWTPRMFAGRVSVDVVEESGTEHAYWIDVSSRPDKSGSEQFDEMLAEIDAYDETLLAGASSGAMEFGDTGNFGGFEALVRLERLRQHGPGFLDAIRDVAGRAHRSLSTVSQTLPLSQVRRLHPSAMRDRRLVGVVLGHPAAVASIDSLQLLSMTAVPTLDTPANRALAALLVRFRAAALNLLERVRMLRLGGDTEDQLARRPRRELILTRLAERAKRMLTASPFAEVTRSETTAAGLTQVAAQPLYSRAYRRGVDALRLGLEGEQSKDRIRVSPTWGVYEVWCFVSVLRMLEHHFGVPMKSFLGGAAGAQLAHHKPTGDGVVQLLFQATFPSEKASASRIAWSLSRERIPDIVLVKRDAQGARWLVLDAKWRGGRQNVLEAMESAHIYHDSLRLLEFEPDACLLLLPGASDVPSLDRVEFWRRHGVGTISGFSVMSAGVKRCHEAIVSWLSDSTMAIEKPRQVA